MAQARVRVRRTGPSIATLAWALHDAANKAEKKRGAAAEKAAAPKLALAKDDLVRSVPYLKLVAMGACMHCGVDAHSQAAHLQPDGKAIKVTDLDTFPLCTVRPDGAGGLYEGCHAQFDQYRLFPREQAMKKARVWIRATQRRVHASGRWPKNVPLPTWLEKEHAKAKPQDEAPAAGAPLPRAQRDRKPRADPRGGRGRPGDRNQGGTAKPAGRKSR